MNVVIIELNKCFECGNPPDEMHHVVPRSRGGTKTIPLCNECHGKAHDIGTREGHSKLIKEGLNRAKKKGIKLGNPNNLTEDVRKRAHQSVKENALNNESNIMASVIILEKRNEGLSYQKIADYLNENGLKTRYNKKFTSMGVILIYNRYKISP